MCDGSDDREQLMEELVYGKTIWCKYCLWGNKCFCDGVCSDFDLLEDEDYVVLEEAIHLCGDPKLVKKMMKFLQNCR